MTLRIRAHVPPAKSAAWPERAIFWPWLVAVALAPVWYGSTSPLAWAANAVLLGGALAAYGALIYLRQRPLPVPLGRIALPLGAIAIVLAWGIIQASPLVPVAWQHPVWRIAGNVLATDLKGTISVYPAATYRAVLWTATAAASFVLALEFGRDSSRAWQIAFALTLSAGAIALYGLIIYFSGNHWVLAEPKHAYMNVPTATFINRDNFAAFLAVSLIVGMSLLFRTPHRDTAQPKNGMRTLAVLVAACLLLVIALFLTASRGGTGMAAIGIGLLFILKARQRRQGRLSLLLTLAVLLAAVVVTAYFLGDFLFQRFAHLGTDLNYRVALDRRMLAGIAASPMLGYGFGAFEQAFTIFRDTTLVTNSIYEYGHDDWLEALFTLGIPVGLLLWSVFLWIALRCWQGVSSGHRGSSYAALALALLMATAFDSLVDFSMQIQGFALPLLVLLGIGVAQSWPPNAAPV